MVTLFTEVHLGLDIDGLPQGQRISQRSGLWTQFSGLVNFASMSWDGAGTAPPNHRPRHPASIFGDGCPASDEMGLWKRMCVL